MKRGVIYGPRIYTARLGSDGGNERIILLTRSHGFYLAVRVLGKYARLAVWRYGLRWHASRS